MSGFNVRLRLTTFAIAAIFLGLASCGSRSESGKAVPDLKSSVDVTEEVNQDDDAQAVVALLVSPENPRPGQVFRVMVTGGKDIRKAEIKVNSFFRNNKIGEKQKRRWFALLADC